MAKSETHSLELREIFLNKTKMYPHKTSFDGEKTFSENQKTSQGFDYQGN